MFRGIFLDFGVPYMLNGFHQVAPYNTFYPQLEEHLNGVGIDPAINKWHEPMALGVVDPHDSLSHPAGVSDVQTESASCVDPDQFINFLYCFHFRSCFPVVSLAKLSSLFSREKKIPNWSEGEQSGSTKDNPFPLPDAFLASKQRNHKNLEGLKQILQEVDLEESRKKELTTALHGCFKDWLYASGNIRQLYFLQND
ncbi:hypothetical protein MTR67_012538 [Solanum verrucosum]|uniref:Uncharacterized protein n=1 Tax=Solanum verrucosum TaxID=315347 RepID=A0AAF0Q9W5_SOLVR|nr:hypothetical protein MTR67_012538 [Solanum verrucosum]